MTLDLPLNNQVTDHQSALAWAYSLYAGVFAFLFSILIFSPVSGVRFAAIAAVSALVCVRIASWLASYFGRSGYGLIACVITAFLFPMVPPLFVIFGVVEERLTELSSNITILEYAKLCVIYYLLGIIYAAPAAFVATLIYNLALVAVRKMQWLAVQQRWI
jgi:hypothetical protein